MCRIGRRIGDIRRGKEEMRRWVEKAGKLVWDV
jgi:hypothetical protein